MKRFHWYFYVGLGLFQSPPRRYLQRTLLFLCPMQLHGFEDNCFHWTQISFLSLRIRPSISWVGPGYNCTESSSSHQCVRILSCHLVCSNCFYLQQEFFLVAAIIFYLQQLYLICSNLKIVICSMSPVGHRNVVTLVGHRRNQLTGWNKMKGQRNLSFPTLKRP